ncbi:MAG: histidine phosphatase family protein [Chloroflexota bacterium]|nr:histidine phosphatase family protein [Chloroflexota bacterium]
MKILPELVEIDFGEWEGKSLKRLKSGRLWKVVQGNPGEFCFPGGESFREAQERVTVALNSLAEKFGRRTWSCA